jgi:hypothetical protein
MTSTEILETSLDLSYDWGYGEGREALRKLYVKAQHSQWLSDEQLPWEVSVDYETDPMLPDYLHPLYGSEIFKKLTEKERRAMQRELDGWLLSQFLHGEQGALLAAAQLTSCVDSMTTKLFFSSQVMDEARHVEVFERFLREKMCTRYPVNRTLRTLLDLLLKDSRWDLKLLGMQIMIEGLALAGFGSVRDVTANRLLKSLLSFVLLDEARHVASGVLLLEEAYRDMSERDLLEREDFVYEASVQMRNRFLYEDVWERLGLDVKVCAQHAFDNPAQQLFRKLLFSRIIPALKRIGLMSPRQRERFHKLGVLRYEGHEDPIITFEKADTELRSKLSVDKESYAVEGETRAQR